MAYLYFLLLENQSPVSPGLQEKWHSVFSRSPISSSELTSLMLEFSMTFPFLETMMFQRCYAFLLWYRNCILRPPFFFLITLVDFLFFPSSSLKFILGWLAWIMPKIEKKSKIIFSLFNVDGTMYKNSNFLCFVHEKPSTLKLWRLYLA